VVVSYPLPQAHSFLYGYLFESGIITCQLFKASNPRLI
jgi:hypothetical protein